VKTVTVSTSFLEVSPPAVPHSVAPLRGVYESHAPGLYRTLRRLAAPGVDPADLLHDVFVVALRRWSDLSRATSPRAWLFGVAVKVASDSRRRARVRRLFGLSPPATEVELKTPEGDLERAQLANAVQRALDAMSGKKREALVLYELEGLSGQEIALALGVPLKTVWTRLHHARRELERQLNLDEVEEGGAP
jgi:RNA polymerase sigma-70 factor (ECF subfamily)